MSKAKGRVSGITLSDLDRRILWAIELAADKSSKTIAEQLDIKPHVVRYRIRKFLKNGLIKSPRAIVNLEKLGLFEGIIYLSFEPISKEEREAFIARSKKNPEITEIFETIGKYDVVLYCCLSSVENFKKLYSKITNSEVHLFERKGFSIKTNSKIFKRSFLISKEPDFIQTNYSTKTTSISSRDWQIVKALAKGRKPEDIPEATFERRKKALEQSEVILSYYYPVIPESLGLQLCFVMISLNDSSEETCKKIFEYSRTSARITRIHSTIGEWDFVIVAEVEHLSELGFIRQEISTLLSRSITAIETLVSANTVKKKSLPSVSPIYPDIEISTELESDY